MVSCNLGRAGGGCSGAGALARERARETVAGRACPGQRFDHAGRAGMWRKVQELWGGLASIYTALVAVGSPHCPQFCICCFLTRVAPPKMALALVTIAARPTGVVARRTSQPAARRAPLRVRASTEPAGKPEAEPQVVSPHPTVAKPAAPSFGGEYMHKSHTN